MDLAWSAASSRLDHLFGSRGRTAAAASLAGRCFGLRIRDAASVDGRRCWASAALGGNCVHWLELRRADAGLRQDEANVVCRLHVARDRSRDRPDLLIARHQQEGRRPPIALDTHCVEAGLGVRELAVAMRRHGAAGVDVRIDQRTKRPRALEPGIKLDPKLPRKRQVGTLTRRHNDPVDGTKCAQPVGCFALEDHLLTGSPDSCRREARDQR